MSSAEVSPPNLLHRGWLLALLPAGFVFALMGAFLHESHFAIGSVTIPWATVLFLTTLVVTIRALSLNMASRLAGGLFFAGWLVATGLLALPNPSGDIVFTSDLGSMGYLMAGAVLGAAATFWPLFLGRAGDGSPALENGAGDDA